MTILDVSTYFTSLVSLWVPIYFRAQRLRGQIIDPNDVSPLVKEPDSAKESRLCHDTLFFQYLNHHPRSQLKAILKQQAFR